MVAAMMTTAFAVQIEITRDSSYAGEATGAGREYTWYKVFDATYDTNSSTGGGSNAGAPGDVTASAQTAAYTAVPSVAAKLGRWVPATTGDNPVAAHWEKANGNLWFTLTPISGSNNYSVTWDNTSETSATAQAAAQWLLDNEVYAASGSMTFANGKWSSANNLDKGYYLVASDTGANLVAATTDVSITEKNVYPPLDKTQGDEDAPTQSDATRSVAVGDVLTYEVKVTIPATAKVGDKILVWDTPSNGLSYNDDVAVKTGTNTGNATVAAATGADVVSGAAWTQLITITDEAQKGTDVIFTCTMTITSAALEDSDKENEVKLKYGNGDDWSYESLPDRVEYTTYYAGIHKFDGSTNADLQGVVFELKENGVAFNVTKSGNVYIPGGSSNSVTTDANGKIIIRGLDNDKTYTLTETQPLPGYNPLDHDVTLTLHLDSKTVVDENGTETTTYSYNESTATTDDTWGDQVENNTGTTLPSTGGVGTTIFYIAGSILVLGAVIFLVTKRRMSSND